MKIAFKIQMIGSDFLEDSTLEKSDEIIGTEIENIVIENNDIEIDKEEISENENTTTDSNTSGDETIDTETKTEEIDSVNCLALTIQEEHKLIAVKNVFLRSIKMSWKVVVSAITLTIIRLLS